MEFELIDFDPKNASEASWESFMLYAKRYHEFSSPDDKREPDEIRKKNLQIQAANPELHISIKIIINKENVKEFIGIFVLFHFAKSSPSYEANKSLVLVSLELLPEYRNNGITKLVLPLIYNFARENDKMVIISNSLESKTRDFINKLGGTVAQVNLENRVYLKNIDWNLMDNWIEIGKRKSLDSELLFYTRIPEDIENEFCDMFTETMNQVPRGDIEIHDMIFSVEQLRREEENNKKLNRTQINAIIKEKNGEISAYSSLTYSPTNNTKMSVGLTSTRDKYRGVGKGKWIKAAIIYKVINEYPTVEYIETGNATENAPMLSINNRIGFKKHREMLTLQITTDALGEYLKSINLN